MASDCQRHCFVEVVKRINDFVSSMNGVKESIYFHEDADYKMNMQKGNPGETLTHRFLLSFTLPCLLTSHLDGNHHQPNASQDVNASENSSNDENLSQTQQRPSLLPVAPVDTLIVPPPNPLSPFYEMPMSSFQESVGKSGFRKKSEDRDPFLPLMSSDDEDSTMSNMRSGNEAVTVNIDEVESGGNANNNLDSEGAYNN